MGISRLADLTVTHEVKPAKRRRERCAQLVRTHGQKLILDPVSLFEFVCPVCEYILELSPHGHVAACSISDSIIRNREKGPSYPLITAVFTVDAGFEISYRDARTELDVFGLEGSFV